MAIRRVDRVPLPGWEPDAVKHPDDDAPDSNDDDQPPEPRSQLHLF
jgi:hypothetical protein